MRQSIQICIVILTLMLFGSTSIVYSQDGEQSNEDTTTTEQTREEKTNGDQSSVEKSNDKPNPLESLVNNLRTRIQRLDSRLYELENPPDSPLRTIVLIIVVLTVLAFAVFIFLGMRMNTQLQNRIDEKDQSAGQEILKKCHNQLNERIQPIVKQGIELNKKLKEIESNRSEISQKQEKFLSTLDNLNNRIDDIELNILNVEPDSETDSIVDYQSQVTLIVQETQDRMNDLADAYRNGEPINLDEIENPSPSQKAILLLNSLARDLHQWTTELEQSGQTDSKLIETLTYRVTDIKDKLKEIRGGSIPTPKQLQEPTDICTDKELDDFQNLCNVDVGRFEGMLSGYEQGRDVNDLAAYNKFILQFIKDRLFNGVARFVPFDQQSKQLDKFLQFVDFEVVPIEIGKTEVDTRVHKIEDAQQTGVKAGTIAKVVSPGLQRKSDGEIVQKPVVIRAE